MLLIGLGTLAKRSWRSYHFELKLPCCVHAILVRSMATQHCIACNVTRAFLTGSISDGCRWFYFRVSGVEGQQLRMRIVNAGEASYPRAWQGYSACASYDRKFWFRISASYDSKAGVLEITHKPTRVAVPSTLVAWLSWLWDNRTCSALLPAGCRSLNVPFPGACFLASYSIQDAHPAWSRGCLAARPSSMSPCSPSESALLWRVAT